MYQPASKRTCHSSLATDSGPVRHDRGRAAEASTHRCPLPTRVRRALFTVSAAAAMSAAGWGQSTWYVNQSATPGGDGRSWATAYENLQQALTDRALQSGDEIWLAAGRYRPDFLAIGDRRATFALVGGVAIYAGFAGDELQRDQRNPGTNLTVLSGDLLGDDGPNFVNVSDNSINVVSVKDTEGLITLDGVTIEGGNADLDRERDSGGGICVERADLLILNCTLQACQATYSGGGASISDASVEILDSTVTGSIANKFGGGIAIQGSSTVVVDRCAILGNSIRFGGGGGGIHSNLKSTSDSLLVSNTVFEGNQLQGHDDTSGGAVSISQFGSKQITFHRCSFRGNGTPATVERGGAISALEGVIVTECTFVNNRASRGGALSFTGTTVSPFLASCSFDANEAEHDGAITGWRITAVDCTFSNNVATSTGGGAVGVGNGSTFMNCNFVDNFTAGDGGAAGLTGFMLDCILVGNASGSTGGAASLGDAHVEGCIFSGNSAVDGGAIVSGRNVVLTNCTIAANTADPAVGRGGGVYIDWVGDATITNCIIWGNMDVGGQRESAQVYSETGSGTFSFNCIQNWTGILGGEMNIRLDPGLSDIDGPDNTVGTLDDDLTLLAGSPAIDAGDNSAASAMWDLRGGPRYVDDPATPDTGRGDSPVIDMGAYEFGSDQFALRLASPSPGSAGVANTFRVDRASSGGQVTFIYATETGSVRVPGCPGFSLDLRRPTVMGTSPADLQGVAVLERLVPDSARGQTVLLQAIDTSECLKSNIVSHLFD